MPDNVASSLSRALLKIEHQILPELWLDPFSPRRRVLNAGRDEFSADLHSNKGRTQTLDQSMDSLRFPSLGPRSCGPLRGLLLPQSKERIRLPADPLQRRLPTAA